MAALANKPSPGSPKEEAKTELAGWPRTSPSTTSAIFQDDAPLISVPNMTRCEPRNNDIEADTLR